MSNSLIPEANFSMKSRAKDAMLQRGWLIIGYGNVLRRDDGVGPRIAEKVAELNLPGVSCVTPHQLLPELAELVSRAANVLFIDASVERESGVKLQKVEARDAEPVLAHGSDPPSLLALCERIFNRRPAAWMLSVPAVDLSFGQELTPQANDACSRAFRMILELLSE
jgi:hydrogenase maturation protease